MRAGTKMIKKIITTILLLSLISSLTGCETVRRKFTRKKKAKTVRPMFYKKDGDFEEKRPPAELYEMHYVYWKTWMDDLIDRAGLNRKRDNRSINEAISNLIDMKKYLTGEKKEELDQYIEEIKIATDRIRSTKLIGARMSGLRQNLDKLKRRVARKFYYKKVKDYIVEE